MTIKAEIIAIGTELLIGHVINTNAAYLSEELNTLGISTYFHSTVGDNPSRIKEILDLAVKRSDLVICTGGLGPTSDDITHEVIAEFCKLKLIEIPELKSALIDKFKKAKRDMPAINLKQALVPEGSRLIPNPRGTATGIILQHHNSTIMTFPGVPSEMRGMFQNHAKSFLREEFRQDLKAGVILSRKIKFFNIDLCWKPKFFMYHPFLFSSGLYNTSQFAANVLLVSSVPLNGYTQCLMSYGNT